MADFPHVQSGRGTLRIRQYENYLKAVRKLKWTPKRQNELEKRVLDRVLQGKGRSDLVPGGKGLRKLRLSFPVGGNPEALRILYYDQLDKGLLHLLFVYPKSRKADLKPAELKHFARMVERIKQQEEREP